MKNAGVDMGIFKTQSTRSASTSAASHLGVNIQIMKTAGWTNAKTFAKLYNKSISDSTSFSQTLLDNVQ